MHRAPLLFALLLPTIARAEWPAGAVVDPGAYLDIPAEGFVSFEQIAAGLVPQAVSLENISGGSSGSIAVYSYDLEDINVYLTVNELTLTPIDDAIALDLDLTIEVGTADTPIDATLGGGLFIELVTETCEIWMDPVDLTLSTQIDLTLNDTEYPPFLEAHIETPVEGREYDLLIDGNAFNSEDCVMGDIVEGIDDALDWLGDDEGIVGIIFNQLQPTLEAQITDLLPLITDSVAEVTASLSQVQPVDLMGAQLEFSLEPTQVILNGEGMRVALGTRFQAPLPDPCIAAVDPRSSRQTVPSTGALYPLAFDGFAPGDQLGILINDDAINQALYAAWRGGLLCQTIRGDLPGIDLPIPLDAGLLKLLAGDAFDPILEDGADLQIATRPLRPPVAYPADDTLMAARVEALGVDMYAAIDGRMARAVGVELAAEMGIAPGFDGTTGQLDVDLAFDASSIESAVIFNDLAPEASERVGNGLSGLLDTLIGPLLESALGDLGFTLPVFAFDLAGETTELGLTDLDLAMTGPAADFVGVYGAIGDVPYSSEGTDGCTGCRQPAGAAPWLWFGLLSTAALRRRKYLENHR